jgi:hypothetical protein
MKVRSICGMIALAAILALLAPCLWAQDGLQGALSRSNVELRSHLGRPFLPTVAAADLDGDNKADGAVLIDSGWEQSAVHRIEIHFTGRVNAALTFESDEPTLAISALDVNRDGATDIVVEQPFSHKRLKVWLNDGHGGFHQGRTEDYPAAAGSESQRAHCQSERQYDPVLCLPPRIDFEIATVRVADFPAIPSSCRNNPEVITWIAETRATAPRSPRSPPLFSRL